MKRTKTLLIILICAGALASGTFCTVRTKCPAYNNQSLLLWFPYSQGQVVSFKSTNNETASITIGAVTVSEPYTHKHRSDIPYGCDAKGSIVSATGSQLRFGIEESITDDGYSNNTYDRYLRFRSLTLYPVNINDSGIILNEKWLSLYHTGFGTPSGTYDLTEEIYTSDTAAARKSGTARLFISKNKGIIGYTTYPDSTNWWLQ